jgi:hypothetical protein
MEPDVVSPAPTCALCGASATPDANYCMACGEPMQPMQPRRARPGRRSLTRVRIVEADTVASSEQPQPTETALATRPASDERSGALTTRLATLATAAWRQPVVRSAVTTGASAVALSLVWRVAGAALSGGRARRALLPTLTEGESLAPMVGDLLRGATPGKRLRRRGRRGEIVEEVVYIRRIFRR